MYTDPRGGSNRKKFNENFFKKWSAPMAYILGFIAADGVVIDARKSSRTCYVSIKICDKDLLEDIRKTMSSKHKIYTTPVKNQVFGKTKYSCKELSTLRFGSKVLFQDLINLGITPRKSLRLNLPEISNKYFPFFVRGYFDGDGCVNTYKIKNYPEMIQVIFTSGSKTFLKNLSLRLSQSLNINPQNINYNSGAFRLKYKKKDSIQVLKFIYQNLEATPFLKRKYLIAKSFIT